MGERLKPIFVNTTEAKRLLGVGNSRFWDLVKESKVRLVDLGSGRKVVDYASLEALRGLADD